MKKKANFVKGDSQGILTGFTKNKLPIRGVDTIRIF
jgi:hypothetical protein